MKGKKLTPVGVCHYFRLTYRSLLFIIYFAVYLTHRIKYGPMQSETLEKQPLIITVIFAVLALEMVLRFFPSRLESPGCQKQFAGNYVKSGRTEIDIQDNNGTVLVLLVWIGFNAIFGALYLKNLVDEGFMILLSCFYSVCDMICILFFCPFQTWFLKNKCCSTCRIYNWDYSMMFTPLFFVAKPYTWGLIALSAALLIRWEITFYRFPERFSESTNDYLKCENCTEKLCAHKKQLKGLWKQIALYREKRLRVLKND